MALKVPTAALRTYDMLKESPRATPRHSDARDPIVLEQIHGRIRELLVTYRISSQIGQNRQTFVFWSEIEPLVREGIFDDFLWML
ncbi:hypothetical protein [Armatimonas sp.]|uniref:hypothetical protein n=1 Tax=Armatimonas sp. TaxID=1872638 RepID=UPI00286CB05B|nr:hypothetical protein [Armatimonas sp.]